MCAGDCGKSYSCVWGGALYLYVITSLYKDKGILIPLILLTYFYIYPEPFVAYSQSFYPNMN